MMNDLHDSEGVGFATNLLADARDAREQSSKPSIVIRCDVDENEMGQCWLVGIASFERRVFSTGAFGFRHDQARLFWNTLNDRFDTVPISG